MAASDESEHVAHYVVWLCVAIFVYISRHPRHSLSQFIISYFAPSEALFIIQLLCISRHPRHSHYQCVILCP